MTRRPKTNTYPPERLKQLGEMFYGQRWKSAVARDLGVNVRTIKKWAAGQMVPSLKSQAKIEALKQRRFDEFERAMR